MKKIIPEKINLLNKATLDSMLEKSKVEIIKKFATVSMKIFEAKSVSAWLYSSNNYELVYQSHEISDSKKSRSDEIIIPVHFGDHIYGKILLNFKDQRKISKNEMALADTIANTAAQALTIRWLIESEQAAVSLAEKQKSTEILLSQERLKTEFIANATHELRTPLAIMKGNVDLALMKNEDLKSAHPTLKKINAEINILSNLLKDMTLLTATSSGQNVSYIMNPIPVDITKLVADLTKRLKTVASKKNIKIKIKNKKIGDLSVAGDQKHLAELFVNIIKNAITYGKNSGNIVIDLDVENNMVKVKISDNGIGVSKENLPKIFDRFYRGDKAHTHDAYGTHSGLGLAIAKLAVGMHGGTIEAESTKGKGSIFTVTLPRLINS